MNSERLKNFRQAAYDLLVLAKDATRELMDAVMTTRNAACLAEFSLNPLFNRQWPSVYEALQDCRPDRKKLMMLYIKQLQQQVPTTSGGDERPRTFTGKCFRAIDLPQKILLVDKIISRVKKYPVVIKKKDPANTTRPKPIKCYLHSIIRFSKNISHQHNYSPGRCSRVLLQSQKQVRIERLAATLPLPILQSSRRRHIQRFLQIKALSILVLWFPLVKEVISRQFTAGSQLVIALDRTQWKEYSDRK